jgi:ferredoxin
LPSDVGVTATPTPAVTEPEITIEVSVPAAQEKNGDDPYIETPRCTSCNECTHINNKMFAYNENKQAYIADPDAGTFRQLVEAAEGCQVSIIHPGKPRNPKEPGLEDLIHRAAEFN